LEQFSLLSLNNGLALSLILAFLFRISSSCLYASAKC
jgi:hypothetical protein